jgi:hypothetical protein
MFGAGRAEERILAEKMQPIQLWGGKIGEGVDGQGARSKFPKWQMTDTFALLLPPSSWPACILDFMKKALEVLNDLERKRLLLRYAIGGAMGATFYIEPVLTYDLDIFIVIPEEGGHILNPLGPIYLELKRKGYAEVGECVEIEGVPVQFLPVYNALLKEALTEAREVFYDSVPTRVLTLEHLTAICVQTGRPKDRDRVRLIREEAKLDMEKLRPILKKHGLERRWSEWTM